MTKKKLIHDLRKKFSSLQQTQKVIYGLLGDAFGQVDVPGRPNYVYIRIPGYPLSTVYNDRVKPKMDLPVLCGYDPIQPDLFQILSTRTSQPRLVNSTKPVYAVPPHARTHEWMAVQAGEDVTFTHLRQLMPYRPTILGGMTMHYYRNVAWIGDEWQLISGTLIDYTEAIPITGSRYMLTYLDVDGHIKSMTGTTVGDITLLDMDDIPNPIPGTIPLAAVRLYGWQTGLIEARSDTDLIDLRWNFFDTSLKSSNYLTGVSHNALPDLQGGVAGQYYHLTLAQLNSKIISGSTGGGGHTIEDDGTPLTQRTNLNFVGGMFSIYDDAGNDATIVSGITLTSPSGGGGGTSDFLGMTFYEEGALITGTQLGESVVSSVTGTLSKVIAYLDYAGLTGTTTLDVHKNGVTIFTNPANRPVISFTGSVAESVPDVTAFNPNDVFTLYADGLAIDADTLGVLLVKNAVGSGGVSEHNDLTGIQGGAVGDYYHLTHAEVISALSGTSGGAHVLQNNGVALPQRTNISLTGINAVFVDDAANDTTLLYISGTSAFDKLSETRVIAGAGASTITFTNIPQDYSHLQVIIQARGSHSATEQPLYYRLNSDSGANYSNQSSVVYGTSIVEFDGINAITAYCGGMVSAGVTGSNASQIELMFSNYRGIFWKTSSCKNTHRVGFITGTLRLISTMTYWKNASPITDITFFLASGTFVSGSLASLYGLR
jgi:hypothetical protein